ncbi:MAG TPA: orotate phosphoribosyltransferase [Candidatus Dormibacteraeota bacterium]|jgi:orotate phosphoribosyltransferase|nr:orotate phosphoribosyltransferase [Candidatus Dormibacteraeota bacterium]
MNATRERLVQILIKTRAFKWSPTPSFPLASGALSRFYIDCRVGLSYPEAREVVGDLLLERIVPPVSAVGGLLIGAYPVAIAASDAAYRKNKEVIRVFAIRKEPKDHGMKKLIEGDVSKGDRVVIVDDVITSGGSTIEAIVRSREAGLIVEQAIAIIDREEQRGKARIEEHGVRCDALCTLSDLKLAAGVQSEVP